MLNRLIVLITLLALAPALHAYPSRSTLRTDSPEYVPSPAVLSRLHSYSPGFVPISQHEYGVAPLPPQEFPYSNGSSMVDIPSPIQEVPLFASSDRVLTSPDGLWRPLSPVEVKLSRLRRELDAANFFWVAGGGYIELFDSIAEQMGRGAHVSMLMARVEEME